ncbi:GGDEF domain-containing protein [Geothrix sp. 21YS21S-4]|uniref:GGDEF domain-containing protein n=1 Tax=Geothrix sp. 21YS21S-4 TaxID=3068889 RepID=UPI0027B8AC17|nr:GGDEF domain-containing protein [Geothrix sp. 21YS21S-4]
MPKPAPAPEDAPGRAGVAPEMPTKIRAKMEGEILPVPVEWALVAYAGTALGRIFPLPAGEALVGRAPQAQVVLLDSEVSRHHARLALEDGRIRVEDLGSTNGTHVNGERLRGVRILDAGDRLAIGGHVLKLVALDSLERAFHETLLDLSTKDPLTGLSNRASTLSELQTRFGMSMRYDRPLAVVVCDLDRFKQVNDTYGHGAGDLVLANFGERLRATLRETDLAGRIGGEEFLMVLPETDLSGAVPFAERLRQALAAAPVLLPSGPLQVTCSLGLAERQPGDVEAGQLLSRADAALYRAKAEGRNRACHG